MPTRLYTLSTLRNARLPHHHEDPGWSQEVPFLRLRGKWLEELGFERGGKVRVEAEPGRLVVTLAEKGEG